MMSQYHEQCRHHLGTVNGICPICEEKASVYTKNYDPELRRLLYTTKSLLALGFKFLEQEVNKMEEKDLWGCIAGKFDKVATELNKLNVKPSQVPWPPYSDGFLTYVWYLKHE